MSIRPGPAFRDWLHTALSCKRFRFAVGANPTHPGSLAQVHRLICAECARYLREMRRLEHQIRRALAELDIPDEREGRAASCAVAQAKKAGSCPHARHLRPDGMKRSLQARRVAEERL